jgi:hypothetical protein
VFVVMAVRLLLAVMIASPVVVSCGTPTEGRTPVKPVAPSTLPIEGDLPSFGAAAGWLNSPPLSPADLRGKVVLVDFGTYSCINWLRHVPYVRAWAAKYRDRGLVVIGVHTPEFGFEKAVDAVRRAVKGIGLTHPMAIDNDYAIWDAFGNQAWPALHFVDHDGRIRLRHDGEGAYEESERILQRLLAEAGDPGPAEPLVSIELRGVEVAADWGSLRTPETYVGHARTGNFASPGGSKRDERRAYAAPARLALNQWALAGEWTMGRQATVLHAAHGRITIRFHARDLHLVMGPRASGTPMRFRVLLDGRPPGIAHGLDVDPLGHGTVTEHRLHQLIRQPGPIVDRTFEIEFLDAGIEAFSFTFG